MFPSSRAYREDPTLFPCSCSELEEPHPGVMSCRKVLIVVQEAERLESLLDDLGAQLAAEQFVHEQLLLASDIPTEELFWELGQQSGMTHHLQMQLGDVIARLVIMKVQSGISNSDADGARCPVYKTMEETLSTKKILAQVCGCFV